MGSGTIYKVRKKSTVYIYLMGKAMSTKGHADFKVHIELTNIWKYKRVSQRGPAGVVVSRIISNT